MKTFDNRVNNQLAKKKDSGGARRNCVTSSSFVNHLTLHSDKFWKFYYLISLDNPRECEYFIFQEPMDEHFTVILLVCVYTLCLNCSYRAITNEAFHLGARNGREVKPILIHRCSRESRVKWKPRMLIDLLQSKRTWMRLTSSLNTS